MNEKKRKAKDSERLLLVRQKPFEVLQWNDIRTQKWCDCKILLAFNHGRIGVSVKFFLSTFGGKCKVGCNIYISFPGY
jgi:hypothetical protein